VDTETPFRPHDGDYDTIGGLVLEKLGRIPVEGDSVTLTEFDPDVPPEQALRWQATVERMDGRRIDLIKLVRLAAEEEPDAGDPGSAHG
jgi:CBS domain containing-hemolysin-like protein